VAVDPPLEQAARGMHDAASSRARPAIFPCDMTTLSPSASDRSFHSGNNMAAHKPEMWRAPGDV
jgi:hypothetical protein